MCRDLVPFHAVEKQGFRDFCEKNISFDLPSANTVGKTALVDVYSVIKQKVIAILSDCFSGTLMMDGWTDKYKANPYFAIRMSFVHNLLAVRDRNIVHPAGRKPHFEITDEGCAQGCCGIYSP